MSVFLVKGSFYDIVFQFVQWANSLMLQMITTVSSALSVLIRTAQTHLAVRIVQLEQQHLDLEPHLTQPAVRKTLLNVSKVHNQKWRLVNYVTLFNRANVLL